MSWITSAKERLVMRKTLIVFACVILCSSFAGAQSTASVCDGEQGAAYGLCNAFCDAMDCDGDDPQASATACNKVQSKFEQVTGHAPPCLEPQLSCVCIEALPNFLAVLSAPVTFCDDIGDTVTAFTEAGFIDVSGAFIGESDVQGYCGVNESGTVSDIVITSAEGTECVAFVRSFCP
jgi:hypothetical protein